jgi:hypothetical protein
VPEYNVSTTVTTEQVDEEQAARQFVKEASEVHADGELLVSVQPIKGEPSFWRVGPKGLRRVEDPFTA